MEQAFPGAFRIVGNPDGAPRSGAFEVELREAGAPGEEGAVLWSKLLTGEPSSLEAVPGIADAVILELRRAS